MIKTINEGDMVVASMVGDVVAVTFADFTWNIKVTLDLDTFILQDATSGEFLHQGDIAHLGITRAGNSYHPTERDRAKILSGFVVAWIMFVIRH